MNGFCISCAKELTAKQRNNGAKFCCNKCKNYHYLHTYHKIVCECCGVKVSQPIAYGRLCGECRKVRQRELKNSIRKIKRTSEIPPNWEEYAKWHKANPDKSYGDFQIEKRKERGELIWK